MLGWINKSLNLYSSSVPEKNPQQDQFITRNIPGQILELQFKCQSQSASQSSIATLTELYKVAIEYYQSKNDRKYKIYRKRMEIFLQKQNIDDILRGKCVELVTIKEEAEKKFADARTKSRGEANRLLDQLDKLQKNNNKIVWNSIIAQQSQLKQRIKKRTTRSNCSTRTKDDEDNEECMLPLSKKFDIDLVLDNIYERGQFKGKKVFI